MKDFCKQGHIKKYIFFLLSALKIWLTSNNTCLNFTANDITPTPVAEYTASYKYFISFYLKSFTRPFSDSFLMPQHFVVIF